MNTLVLGRRGLGKTTLAEHLAFELNKHVVAFDPGNQFRNAKYRTSDLNELIDILESSEPEETFFASFVPDGDPDVEFTLFAAQLWAFGDFVLVIDEAHELQSPGKINPQLARYIRRAPRREKGDPDPVDLIQTTHLPVDLNKLSFSLSDDAYLFRLTRQRDIERIEQEFGLEVANAVASARTPETDPPGRDVVHVNITTLQFDVITDSRSWNERIAKPNHQEVNLNVA